MTRTTVRSLYAYAFYKHDFSFYTDGRFFQEVNKTPSPATTKKFFQEINARQVDDIQLEFFYQPKSISCLVACIALLVYMAFSR